MLSPWWCQWLGYSKEGMSSFQFPKRFNLKGSSEELQWASLLFSGERAWHGSWMASLFFLRKLVLVKVKGSKPGHSLHTPQRHFQVKVLGSQTVDRGWALRGLPELFVLLKSLTPSFLHYFIFKKGMGGVMHLWNKQSHQHFPIMLYFLLGHWREIKQLYIWSC